MGLCGCAGAGCDACVVLVRLTGHVCVRVCVICLVTCSTVRFEFSDVCLCGFACKCVSVCDV